MAKVKSHRGQASLSRASQQEKTPKKEAQPKPEVKKPTATRKRLSSKEKQKRLFGDLTPKKAISKKTAKQPVKKEAAPKKSAPKAKTASDIKSGIDLRGESVSFAPEIKPQIRPMQLVTDQEMVGSATMFMRWSVDPKIIESLEKSGVLDSALILINVSQAGIIDRTIEGDKPFQKFRKPEVIVAKLTDVGVYIQFKAPCRHFVVATIVTAYRGHYDPLDKYNTANVIKRLVEEKTDVMSDYAPEEDIRLQTVFDMDTLARYVNTGCVFKVGFFPIKGDGSGVHWWGDVSSKNLYYQAALISVDVDPKLFADKPWDWRWLNWKRENKPRDECQARGRRLYAYTLQPIVWLVILVFYLIAYTLKTAMNIAVVLAIKIGFLTRSRIHWPSVFDVGSDISDSCFVDRDGDEVNNPIDRSIFITDRRNRLRPKWVMFFAPAYCVPTLGVFMVADTFLPLSLFVYVALNGIGAMVIILLLGEPIVKIMIELFSIFFKVDDGYDQQPVQKNNSVKPAPPAINPQIVQALTSELSPADVRVSAIPRPAQTFWLRLVDFKRIVCKPFAG